MAVIDVFYMGILGVDTVGILFAFSCLAGILP